MFVLASEALCLLVVLAGVLVTVRYWNVFHPLLMPFLTLLVMAVLAPWAQQGLLEVTLPDAIYAQVSWLTALYLAGLAIPFLLPVDPLLPVYRALVRPLEIPCVPVWRTGYVLYSLGLAGGFLVVFGLLLRDSPEGWNWLLNPRYAYLKGRTAVGHWYVLAQSLLFLTLTTYLYFGRPRHPLVLAGMGMLFGGLSIYFGSKAAVVSVVTLLGLYYHYYVREIRPLLAAGAALAVIPLVLLSPFLQGNFDTIGESFRYYDYFENTAWYLYRADRFGPQYGAAAASDIWQYVPRRLYPEKPFIYGILEINEYFWPGQAREGHTPAFLPWVSYHLDFGAVGVFLGGLLLGWISKAVFSHFLETRSFIAWLTFLQLSYVSILKHTPALYYLVLLVGLAATLQGSILILSWTTGRTRPTELLREPRLFT